jgi:hypothetical protein
MFVGGVVDPSKPETRNGVNTHNRAGMRRTAEFEGVFRRRLHGNARSADQLFLVSPQEINPLARQGAIRSTDFPEDDLT